ncbi:MAG TPA: EamA family transporter [Caulobacteraceae bacterium]|nr:EamA family transporter [Caulobacteraceae bacterium]
MNRSLSLAHLALALVVMAVWGTNFVVIRAALAHLPPLFMAGLRFLFAFAPMAFFIRRPAVPWRQLALYGVLIGAGQFGCLFMAMKGGAISPGLASLVVQTQVFFTIGLAAALSGERVRAYQIAALALAAAGLATILVHSGAGATPLGLGLTLAAALSWAAGNLVSRKATGVNMLAYMVWSSLFAVPPLLILSLLVEGPAAIASGVAGADAGTWAAVLWQSVGNTLFGYGVWSWLLARYPAASVTPLALTVPVFGMSASALILGEPLPAWKLGAAALVLAGLAVNLLWPAIERRLWRAATA